MHYQEYCFTISLLTITLGVESETDRMKVKRCSVYLLRLCVIDLYMQLTFSKPAKNHACI